MPNTLIVARNHAASSPAALRTPYPAADPNFPAANVVNPDRYIVTAYPDGTGVDAVYYVDVGAGRTTNVVGLLGLAQSGAAAAFPSYVDVRRGSVFPEDGSWVSAAGITIAQDQPDPYALLGSPVTSRYWKFTLSPTFGGFSLAKLLVGQVTDLGVSFSQGSTDSLVRQRVRNENVFGAHLATTTGRDRHRLEMVFAAVPGTIKDAIVQAAAAAPFVMVHPTAGLLEVDLTDDELQVAPRFGDCWDLTLRVEQLP